MRAVKDDPAIPLYGERKGKSGRAEGRIFETRHDAMDGELISYAWPSAILKRDDASEIAANYDTEDNLSDL